MTTTHDTPTAAGAGQSASAAFRASRTDDDHYVTAARVDAVVTAVLTGVHDAIREVAVLRRAAVIGKGQHGDQRRTTGLARRRRQRLLRNQPVADTRHRDDHRLGAFAQLPPQRRHLHREVAFLDHQPRPGTLHQRFLAHRLTARVEQRFKQGVAPMVDRHRLAAARQLPAVPVQDEVSKARFATHR